MKTKVITVILLTVFLSSMLSMAFVTSAIAGNPVISKVERITDVCWFHLMTGQYPPDKPAVTGELSLDYQNLSPDRQYIMLTVDPDPENVFIYWPYKEMEPMPSLERIFWVDPFFWDPYECFVTIDYVGLSGGEPISVRLELVTPKVENPEFYWDNETAGTWTDPEHLTPDVWSEYWCFDMLLYEGEMTIPPLR